MQTTTIGFIGAGTIGGPIARRLLEHKHALAVFDVDPNATLSLVEHGARSAKSIDELARQCGVIFLSLPGPTEIEAVMRGDGGLLKTLESNTTVIDLSTNSVALNRDLADEARAKDIHYLDAPVSGGKAAALKGTLSVMVGGDESAFNNIRALIECFAEHIFHMGDSGSGTLTKLVNNQIFLCASVLIQEGFLMGAKAGMDPSKLLEVLKVSSAGSLLGRAPLVLSRSFNSDLFALAIASKDVGVALASGKELGVDMPLTEAADGVYQQALAQGLGKEDFFATAKVLESAAGIEIPPLRKPKK